MKTTLYNSLIERIKGNTVKTFKMTLLAEYLEYYFPDIEFDFNKIAIEIDIDDFDNIIIFKLFLDDELVNLENLRIYSCDMASDIAYVTNEMLKKHDVDLKSIEIINVIEK